MRGVVAGAIRIWLADQSGPQTREAIAEGVGMAENVLVYRVIGRMKRDGHLVAEAAGYVLGKGMDASKYATEEERKEAKRVRDRQRKRRQRLEAGVAPRVIGPKARHPAKAPYVPVPKVHNPKPLPGRVFQPAEQPKHERLMTSFEWEAKGGKVEVLPGIQVKPLSYGGHRDMNTDSMRRSLAA